MDGKGNLVAFRHFEHPTSPQTIDFAGVDDHFDLIATGLRGLTWTLAEASEWLGESSATGEAPALGEHTESWRAELASFEG